MSSVNQTSIQITAADLADISTSIQTLQTKLLPYLVSLSPDDRRELPKMGDKTISFVQKTQEYCAQNPDLVPPFLDVKEFKVDITAYEQIRSMYQPLLQITDTMRDTMLLTGSEAFSASLMFYNSIRHAAKSKVQKAGTIYNDLSGRFPGRGKKEPTPSVQ